MEGAFRARFSMIWNDHKSVRTSIWRKLRTHGNGSGWAASHRGWNEGEGGFSGVLAGWLVAFIAMQMASTPHAASTAREKHEETRGRQGLDAARIRTFSRVSLPSLLLLFPTFFTLFHPLSTILRSLLTLFLLYPLYPFSILLFPLNSPLVFSLPLQFRVICAYIRPLYHFFSFSLLSSTKEFIFSQKKKKENKDIKEERRKIRWHLPFLNGN